MSKKETQAESPCRNLRFGVLITEALRSDGTALWEEACSVMRLNELRAQNVTAFAMQYQNDVSVAEGKVFKPPFARWTKLPDCDRYMAIDPAISTQTASSDCTAIVCIGATTAGQVYVVETIKRRVLPDEAERLCQDMYLRNNPVTLAVEAVAYQRALYYSLLQKRLYDGSYMRVRADVKPDQDKVRRILTLEPLFTSGRIFLPASAPDLEEELLRFKPVKSFGHGTDDLLDALALALKSVFWRKAAATQATEPNRRRTKYCGTV